MWCLLSIRKKNSKKDYKLKKVRGYFGSLFFQSFSLTRSTIRTFVLYFKVLKFRFNEFLKSSTETSKRRSSYISAMSSFEKKGFRIFVMV